MVQFKTIIKKLSLASLQIEKNKPDSRSIKQSSKFVKTKTISAKLSNYCYKGYIANNNLANTDSEFLDLNSFDSDKDKTVEIVTALV